MELNEEQVAGADCVLILTAHPQYDWEWIVSNAQVVVDARGATRSVAGDKVVLVSRRTAVPIAAPRALAG